jgi:hypothetical protein
MTEFLPKLKAIQVDPMKLLLDPNNPRFVSSKEERVPEEKIGDSGIVTATANRMFPDPNNDPYRIVELMHSIETNGWQPVDSIFVRKYDNSGRYVVLEGNRRVTAVQRLLNNKELPASVRSDLSEIEVMEVIGDEDHITLERQISYLLGVRHHGSLKRWSPFAQANNIFECFMEKAGLMKEEDFRWDEEVGESVADALSIPATGKRSVEERLSVLQAMKSVADLPNVGPGRMLDRYFSLFVELLARRDQKLGKYIRQDRETFRLDEESAKKMEDLCHFSIPKREDAPIANPQEWRPLNEILKDKDEAKRETNLHRVEIDKELPSVVWAQRQEELKKLEWSIWLQKVHAVIKKVQLGQIKTNDEQTRKTVTRLIDVLDQLSKV